MRGGTGNDTYYVDNIGDQITEIDGAGTDRIRSFIDFDLANAEHVENLELLGSGNLNGTGNNSANIIKGNSGNNILIGLGGNDILVGNNGDDIFQINTGAGRDFIFDYDPSGDSIQLLGGIERNNLNFTYANGNLNIIHFDDLLAIVQNTTESDINFI